MPKKQYGMLRKKFERYTKLFFDFQEQSVEDDLEKWETLQKSVHALQNALVVEDSVNKIKQDE